MRFAQMRRTLRAIALEIHRFRHHATANSSLLSRGCRTAIVLLRSNDGRIDLILFDFATCLFRISS